MPVIQGHLPYGGREQPQQRGRVPTSRDIQYMLPSKGQIGPEHRNTGDVAIIENNNQKLSQSRSKDGNDGPTQGASDNSLAILITGSSTQHYVHEPITPEQMQFALRPAKPVMRTPKSNAAPPKSGVITMESSKILTETSGTISLRPKVDQQRKDESKPQTTPQSLQSESKELVGIIASSSTIRLPKVQKETKNHLVSLPQRQLEALIETITLPELKIIHEAVSPDELPELLSRLSQPEGELFLLRLQRLPGDEHTVEQGQRPLPKIDLTKFNKRQLSMALDLLDGGEIEELIKDLPFIELRKLHQKCRYLGVDLAKRGVSQKLLVENPEEKNDDAAKIRQGQSNDISGMIPLLRPQVGTETDLASMSFVQLRHALSGLGPQQLDRVLDSVSSADLAIIIQTCADGGFNIVSRSKAPRVLLQRCAFYSSQYPAIDKALQELDNPSSNATIPAASVSVGNSEAKKTSQKEEAQPIIQAALCVTEQVELGQVVPDPQQEPPQAPKQAAVKPEPPQKNPETSQLLAEQPAQLAVAENAALPVIQLLSIQLNEMPAPTLPPPHPQPVQLKEQLKPVQQVVPMPKKENITPPKQQGDLPLHATESVPLAKSVIKHKPLEQEVKPEAQILGIPLAKEIKSQQQSKDLPIVKAVPKIVSVAASKVTSNESVNSRAPPTVSNTAPIAVKETQISNQVEVQSTKQPPETKQASHEPKSETTEPKGVTEEELHQQEVMEVAAMLAKARGNLQQSITKPEETQSNQSPQVTAVALQPEEAGAMAAEEPVIMVLADKPKIQKPVKGPKYVEYPTTFIKISLGAVPVKPAKPIRNRLTEYRDYKHDFIQIVLTK